MSVAICFWGKPLRVVTFEGRQSMSALACARNASACVDPGSATSLSREDGCQPGNETEPSLYQEMNDWA